MERVKIGKRGRGRPKGQTQIATNTDRRTLAELARSYTKDALLALVEIFQDKAAGAARVTAAIAVLDRGYGKPAQSHELTGPNQGPVMMRLDQSILAQLPTDTLVALQALLAGLSKGDISALVQQQSADSSEYEDTLH